MVDIGQQGARRRRARAAAGCERMQSEMRRRQSPGGGAHHHMRSGHHQFAASRHSTSRPSRVMPSGEVVGHLSKAIGQRGWKRQPGGMFAGIGIACRRARHRACRGPAPASAPRRAARACRDARARGTASSDRRALDDAAEIHHRDLARDMLHHREIVADEEIGEAELAPQLGEQVEDLRLHRDVERARSARRRPRCAAAARARARWRRAGAARPRAAPAGARAISRREADAVEHLRRRARAVSRGRTLPCAASGSADDVARCACRGLSEEIRVLEHRLDQPRARSCRSMSASRLPVDRARSPRARLAAGRG